MAEWNRRREAGEPIPYLSGADLREADLTGANLIGANLTGADLSKAHLREADLSDSRLCYARLSSADLRKAKLARANLGWTIIGNVDLSSVTGLSSARHVGPSTVGVDALASSRGRIPETFLRGCGLKPWEVLAARLYDPALSANEISDLQYAIFDQRTKVLTIGGVFLSYARRNSAFVDRLHDVLQEKGASVWLDRHDLKAGPLQTQVDRALRQQDVVVLVLSRSSVRSDWVEHELRMARERERKERRDILCPVALDGSWKKRVQQDVLWEQLLKKNVLDFSKWQDDGAFAAQFAKLLDGLKLYYKSTTGGGPLPKLKAKG